VNHLPQSNSDEDGQESCRVSRRQHSHCTFTQRGLQTDQHSHSIGTSKAKRWRYNEAALSFNPAQCRMLSRLCEPAIRMLGTEARWLRGASGVHHVDRYVRRGC